MFDDQGKQTSVFFSFAANKRKLPLSVSSVFTCIVYIKRKRDFLYRYTCTYTYTYTSTYTPYIYIYILIYIYIYIYIMPFQTENGSPRRFSLIHLPFALRTNGSLSFVRSLMKKQTEIIHLQTN